MNRWNNIPRWRRQLIQGLSWAIVSPLAIYFHSWIAAAASLAFSLYMLIASYGAYRSTHPRP